MKKAFCFLLLFLLSCSMTPKSGWKPTRDQSALAAREIALSSIKLEISYVIDVRELQARGLIDEPFLEEGGSGTGTVLAVDRHRFKSQVKGLWEDRPGSLVLTADHVCSIEPIVVDLMFFGSFVLPTSQHKYDVISPDGSKHAARVMLEDKKNDLCLLEVDGVAGKPAKVASELPPQLVPIMYAGAPKGIWGKWLVPVFDGRYVGVDEDGYIVMTTPAAPGSSGSGMFYEGELFGVLTMVTRGFSNGAYGIQLVHVRKMMDDSGWFKR